MPHLLQPNRHNTYFGNLDALRFFSFLSVFLSHTLHLPDTGNKFIEVLINLITFNYLGVPFFFSLSSFLITYRLLTEKEKIGTVELLKFYRNRILRIWPAYFIILIICFAALPIIAGILHSKGPTTPSLLPFLFFYVNFYIIQHGENFTFALLILWSISIEEQFYLVWGAAIKFVSGKWMLPLVILLFVFSMLFSFYFLTTYPKEANNLAIHSFFVLQFFCAGAFAAYSYVRFKNVLPVYTLRITLIAAYILLPFSYLFVKDMVLLTALRAICYGLIIYDQCFNEHRLFNAGKSIVINYLGKISYGLYLYHAVIIVLLQTQFHFFGAATDVTTVRNLLQAGITLMITVAVAHFSYRYIELKFLALKKE